MGQVGLVLLASTVTLVGPRSPAVLLGEGHMGNVGSSSYVILQDADSRQRIACPDKLTPPIGV